MKAEIPVTICDRCSRLSFALHTMFLKDTMVSMCDQCYDEVSLMIVKWAGVLTFEEDPARVSPRTTSLPAGHEALKKLVDGEDVFAHELEES